MLRFSPLFLSTSTNRNLYHWDLFWFSSISFVASFERKFIIEATVEVNIGYRMRVTYCWWICTWGLCSQCVCVYFGGSLGKGKKDKQTLSVKQLNHCLHRQRTKTGISFVSVSLNVSFSFPFFFFSYKFVQWMNVLSAYTMFGICCW